MHGPCGIGIGLFNGLIITSSLTYTVVKLPTANLESNLDPAHAQLVLPAAMNNSGYAEVAVS